MRDLLAEELANRRKELEEIIREKQAALSGAPEGRLRCVTNKGRPTYYHVTATRGSTGHYLGKDNLDLAKTLAQKTYDEEILHLALEEDRRLMQLQKHRDPFRLEQVYDRCSPLRKELITPIALPDDEFISQWQKRYGVFQPQGFADDEPEHYSQRGLRVRSKSEALIADRMDALSIPYFYGRPVYLKGYGLVYPDFTILNVRLRKTIIWEHLGKMDDPAYVNRNLGKLFAYEKNGYVVGDSLILSFESKAHNLHNKYVDRMIQSYLL